MYSDGERPAGTALPDAGEIEAVWLFGIASHEAGRFESQESGYESAHFYAFLPLLLWSGRMNNDFRVSTLIFETSR